MKNLSLLPPSEVSLLPLFFFTVVVIPNVVKHSYLSLTHLLKTLQKDGIWHCIFLSFILVQNEFDTMLDYCGKKKKKKRKECSLSRHKPLLKLGK